MKLRNAGRYPDVNRRRCASERIGIQMRISLCRSRLGVSQQLADDWQAEACMVVVKIMKTHASSSTRHDVLERIVICATQRMGAATYRRTADFDVLFLKRDVHHDNAPTFVNQAA